MNIRSLILVLKFAFLWEANAQFVPLQDTILANALCTKFPALVSSDCKNIDTSAASQRTGTILIAGSKLKNVQELTYFYNATGLNLVNNQVEDLPDLAKLKRLVTLDLRFNPWNKISQLEPVKGTLQILFLTLTNGATISDLRFLEGYTRIKSLHILNGQAQVLPDFTKLPRMKSVLLRNNLLTFEDFLPLTEVPGYDTIFSIFPQNSLTKDTVIKLQGLQSFTLSVGIDTAVPNITYDWYKNDTLVQSGASPKLVFRLVKKKDAATYYVKMSHPHPFFVGKFLQTGNFKLEVECAPRPDFQYNIATGCQNSSLQITGINNTGTFPFTSFVIKNELTSKSYSLKIGGKEVLPNGAYTVSIKDSAECSYEYPQGIVLKQEPCDDLFSPNADGIEDEFFIDGAGVVQIRNKQGMLVNELPLPAFWNGTDKNGKQVGVGIYVLTLPGNVQRKVTVLR